MKRNELSILGLAISQLPDTYIVILKDKESDRRLPVIVGSNEAQSIALAIERLKAPRPLTHDTFFNIMVCFDINLKEVYIHDIIKGVFHAEISCERYGKTERFDVRSSDAIAMALRFGIPIYTNEKVLNFAGVLPISNKNEEKTGTKNMLEMSPEEIQLALKDAVQKEDYETASILRDLLKQKL